MSVGLYAKAILEKRIKFYVLGLIVIALVCLMAFAMVNTSSIAEVPEPNVFLLIFLFGAIVFSLLNLLPSKFVVLGYTLWWPNWSWIRTRLESIKQSESKLSKLRKEGKISEKEYYWRLVRI